MSKLDDKNRAPSTGGQIVLSEEEKKFFIDNNNFIDYFIEIGVKPDIFANNNITANSNIKNINSKISPEIISKFPHFEKKMVVYQKASHISRSHNSTNRPSCYGPPL